MICVQGVSPAVQKTAVKRALMLTSDEHLFGRDPVTMVHTDGSKTGLNKSSCNVGVRRYSPRKEAGVDTRGREREKEGGGEREREIERERKRERERGRAKQRERHYPPRAVREIKGLKRKKEFRGLLGLVGLSSVGSSCA